MKELRRMAEQGYTDAQYHMGYRSYHANGGLREDQEATRWFRLAGAQEHAKAQYFLGLMYDKGLGVPQNHIQAYMWFTLSAEQGFEPAKELIETLKKEMTLDQLAEAQRLAREWTPKGE